MKPPLTMTATLWREGRTANLTLPCYWWYRSAWQSRQGVDLTDLDTEHLLVDRGADVQPGDRVLSIVDHLGATVFSSSDFRVLDHITHERLHLDCTLKYGRTGGARH